MSKCECCKEENSDLITYKGYKMCPACYMGYVSKVNVCENNVKYETEINQLKQENEKLFLQLSKQEVDEHKPAYCTLAGTDCKYLGKVEELKQQLAEKDKEIAHLKEKDNYHLRYELAGADETITNLKQQLAEKDNLIEFGREEIRRRNKRIDEIVERDKKLFDNKNKEIECLNKRIDRYENMFRSRIKRTGDMQKDIELYVNQLAIQELEKVKTLIQNAINFETNFVGVYDAINNQIKELKGESK